MIIFSWNSMEQILERYERYSYAERRLLSSNSESSVWPKKVFKINTRHIVLREKDQIYPSTFKNSLYLTSIKLSKQKNSYCHIKLLKLPRVTCHMAFISLKCHATQDVVGHAWRVNVQWGRGVNLTHFPSE